MREYAAVIHREKVIGELARVQRAGVHEPGQSHTSGVRLLGGVVDIAPLHRVARRDGSRQLEFAPFVGFGAREGAAGLRERVLGI